eukprot:4540512-Pyramimonas_sp.AAC.1
MVASLPLTGERGMLDLCVMTCKNAPPAEGKKRPRQQRPAVAIEDGAADDGDDDDDLFALDADMTLVGEADAADGPVVDDDAGALDAAGTHGDMSKSATALGDKDFMD